MALAAARAVRATGGDDVELVAVDSMQVYRGMDIGTAKPTPAERAEIGHHGLDLAGPSEDVTVVRFKAEIDHALGHIAESGSRSPETGTGR